jgi:DNA-binding response OmpR family regulator
VLLVVPLRLLLSPEATDATGCATGSPTVILADSGSAGRTAAGLPEVAGQAGDGMEASAVARFAGWTVDLGSRRLTGPRAESRTLPPAEFRLLVAFLAEPRRVIPRATLARRALQDRDVHCARTLDVYVSRLRRHLRPARRLPGPIGTVRSIGYVLNADVQFDGGSH